MYSKVETGKSEKYIGYFDEPNNLIKTIDGKYIEINSENTMEII